MKFCTKCEKWKEEFEFGNSKNWCLKCHTEYSTNYYYEHKEECLEKHRNYFQTKTGKFSKYKTKAKERSIEFNLSYEEFINFWQSFCFYCNSEIKTIGLDRINNKLGYIIYNIVPCCSVCNILKNNLEIYEWIDYVKQISEFLNFGKNREINYIYKNKSNYKLNRQFSQCKYSALRRNKEFNLTFEEFVLFNGVPCHYCGTITNVICLDRINNELGYDLNNVVSACKICNNGKNTLLYNVWVEHIEKLSKFEFIISKG